MMKKPLFAVAFVASRTKTTSRGITTDTEYGVQFWAAVSKAEAEGLMMEKLKKTMFPAKDGFDTWDCGAVPVPQWDGEKEIVP